MIPATLTLPPFSAREVGALALATAGLLGLAFRARPTGLRAFAGFVALLVGLFCLGGLHAENDWNAAAAMAGGVAGTDAEALLPVAIVDEAPAPPAPLFDLAPGLPQGDLATVLPLSPPGSPAAVDPSSLVAPADAGPPAPPPVVTPGVIALGNVAAPEPADVPPSLALPAPAAAEVAVAVAPAGPAPPPVELPGILTLATADAGAPSSAGAGDGDPSASALLPAPPVPAPVDTGLTLASLPGPATPAPAPLATAGLWVVSNVWQPVRLTGSRLAFVLDRSGSMARYERLDRVKEETLKILRSLPDGAEFQVLLFNSGSPTNRDASYVGLGGSADVRWLRKDEAAMKTVEAAFATIPPWGGTDPFPALKRALQLGPTDVFFLTDGRDFSFTADEITELNALNKAQAPIHGTFVGEAADAAGDNPVKALCQAHHGTFRFHEQSIGSKAPRTETKP